VIGCGINGEETARLLAARSRSPVLWDVDEQRRRGVAERLGLAEAKTADEALRSDVVMTVTPGSSILYAAGSLQPGQHVSLMGADGPGKAEVAIEELRRARLFCDDWEQDEPIGILSPRLRLFCDDWEQASHGGELTGAVEAGLIAHEDVTQLGDVLAGMAPGRQHADDITLFDSTGLAIQDLAIAKVALSRADELDVPTLDL
jgi:ornithine cyclodeaminase/alanine dehydrogenase-like protein (mu-crystallin family)